MAEQYLTGNKLQKMPTPPDSKFLIDRISPVKYNQPPYVASSVPESGRHTNELQERNKASVLLEYLNKKP